MVLIIRVSGTVRVRNENDGIVMVWLGLGLQTATIKMIFLVRTLVRKYAELNVKCGLVF